MKPLFAFAAAIAAAAASPADAQNAVDRASLIVAQGMAAEQANDGRAMLAAARGLEALGARAVEGDDLAAYWRKRARALGVRDRQPPVRGRALGPAYRRGVLAPGQALSTQQVFLAGQKAEVALVPEPGRTLAIRIAGRDEQICERTASAPRAACSWLPIFTNRVEIRVANQGAHPARYYLVTN